MEVEPREAVLNGRGALEDEPFDSRRWSWDGAQPEPTEHLGRPCVRLESTTGTLAGVELLDGVIEVELAVGRERGFHGVVWRVQDPENCESFFVRPHQMGNPDAVQYTPVFNGVSAWQSMGRGSGRRSPFRWATGSASESPSSGRAQRYTSATERSPRWRWAT